MKRIVRSALLPCPPERMFELVNDVARYPEFLPWCAAAEVLEEDEHGMLAALTVRNARITERVVTRNRARFPDSIELSLVEGPLQHLVGLWSFARLGDAGCRVELVLDYEISRGLLQRVVAGLVGRVTTAVVDAFCARARVLHP